MVIEQFYCVLLLEIHIICAVKYGKIEIYVKAQKLTNKFV